jgi:xanthine dehydrogenase accessory factor
MLLAGQDWLAGSISGGCLEGDVANNAWEKTANGPVLVTYDATSDDDIVWGFGLGCNGLVQVLLQRLPPDGGVLNWFARVVEKREPLLLATVISAGDQLGQSSCEDVAAGAAQGSPSPAGSVGGEGAGGRGSNSLSPKLRAELNGSRSKVITLTGQTCLLERIDPPRKLYIFGAGHDAIPLANMAQSVGFHVAVVDHRAAYCNKERFLSANETVVVAPKDWGSVEIERGAAAVVMTHNYLSDVEILKNLLASESTYIGLLGPRRRTDKMLDELGATADNRIHSPIGLDIGAEGPEQIALAILAEIQANANGRTGGHLRDREGSLT